MPRFRLEEEEKIGILLYFAIVGVMALCGINVFERSLDFALLRVALYKLEGIDIYKETHLVKGHAVLNEECNS